MKRYALHWLVALNLLLVAGLAWMWIGSDGRLRNVHWQVPSPQTTDYAAMVPPLPGITPADTRQFIAMLERPLFSLTRRPPPPSPPSQAAEKQPEDNLSTAQLTGLFYGNGEGGIIVQMAGKPRRVRLNEIVEGWTLTSVQDRSVTFTKDGQTRVLQLPRALVSKYSGLPPATGADGGAGRPTTRPPIPPAEDRSGAAASPDNPSPRQPRQPVLRPSFGGGAR